MTITAQRILDELGNRAWSGFNKDNMIFTSEDSAQARAELNCALRYLINLEDFPFRSKEKQIMAIRNISSYAIPEGQITDIYNKDTLEKLTFVGDSSTCDKTLKGKPTSYWIETSNPSQSIRLYPIPDNKYNLNIVFNQYAPVMNGEGATSFEFQNKDDFINMPDNLAYLFMDCLVMRTMQQNNKDEQDENYRPMIDEFNEMWRVFLKACKPVSTVNRIVW